MNVSMLCQVRTASKQIHFKIELNGSSMPRDSKQIVKIACDRDEATFMAVDPVERALFPLSMNSSVSCGVETMTSVSPEKFHG